MLSWVVVGKTSITAVLEKLGTIQMIDVCIPTCDGCCLILPRYTQPDDGSETAVASPALGIAVGTAAAHHHRRIADSAFGCISVMAVL